MFREPIGNYYVSIKNVDTDETGDIAHRRRVPITIFYPSKEWKKECPYKDGAYQKSAPHFVDNGVRTYCGIDAEFINTERSLPVVIYSHGLTGFEMESTVLCADIASKGYIVASVGHPYGSSAVTYTDGSTFIDDTPFENLKKNLNALEALWYEDILAATKKLREMNSSASGWSGKLNMNSVGILGVSFGGCCGIAAVLKDDTYKYAVNLDGSLLTELDFIYKDKPILILCSRFNVMAYRKLSVAGCTSVDIEKIKKVTHWEYSDGIYLSDKGKSNREWADRVSKYRAERITDFIGKVSS